jgi:phage FluMu gp28-like protein
MSFPGKAKIRPAKDALLLPYQSTYINDRARLVLVEKSRQIGFSWATALGLVRDKVLSAAAAKKAGVTPTDDWVSSRDEEQAVLFIRDCKAFASVYDKGAQDLGERVIDEKGNKAHVLRFSNGQETHSMSSNPDAQAGKRGNRVLDEFALHGDPRRLYTIAYPGITWGGSLRIISTHRGSANFFNELTEEIKHKGNPKGFSLHTVTLQRALEDGFLYKLQSKLPEGDERQGFDEAGYFDWVRSGCADDESFQQEYCCVPADDNSAFLSYDLIASCEYRPTETWEAYPDGASVFTGPLYVGVDIGRKHDLTVIWVFEKLGDVLYTRAIIELKGQRFAAQEAALYPWIQIARRCCIDSTGLGMQLAERAQEKFGKYKVEPVNFSGAVKEELAYPARARFEDRTLRLPNRKEIRADLRAIKKETTAAGNIRFTADASPNGHADRFWAMALGVHAAKQTFNAEPIWLAE